MTCKIISATTTVLLEQDINEWLKENTRGFEYPPTYVINDHLVSVIFWLSPPFAGYPLSYERIEPND